MTKEQQNLAWACLPKEVREEIRSKYSQTSILPRKEQYELGVLHTFENTFGHHNLTSATEPPELLFVERSKVMRKYKFANICEKDHPDKKYWEGAENTLIKLFSNKCLPDKEPSVQVEPKFKKGDKVKVFTEVWNKIHTVVEVKGIYPQFTYKLSCSPDGWFAESTLEPYSEPETKDNMESANFVRLADEPESTAKGVQSAATAIQSVKELNLCELLRGCEGEEFYLLDCGCVTLDGIQTHNARGDSIVFLSFHSTNFDSGSIIINSNGKARNYGSVLLFPSRALYEKYPLDPYSAWMEWKSERTPKRWRAEKNDSYYIISASGETKWCQETNSELDEMRYTFGNYFEDESLCRQAAEAVRECLQKFHEQNKK